ncbi:hypothetical protein OQJ46_00865 [Microbulbifer thermotolerans]|uniref:Uncharacterized protein n=1 Tax=Microbulbifer thermotolerans TaxID=252514 RepID=A0AB35I323_MICTH|nr:hypothetical protein [Microbulbifer thermotolerans]MCX2781538.1 hypothetical protein [Microbulbifer thermotolerans]MCX2794695.1 hypothetical protein [Microbulbifer thermotolerans]MCX2803391.1 hypothetical protein [Microbulbifer thermotolerans]MCX2836417.1 hypothetical protein [Microbulbifer thermotolerans]MCX2843168.1 hypothetical protein [Microbulbifer thermotolerans]
MKDNYLVVTADVEDDGTIGLNGIVSARGFSGTSEAWFNVSQVIDLSEQLEHFAKTTENPPEIFGGNLDGEGSLINKLLSLRFYSLSNYRVGVQVEFADHPYTGCRTEEIACVKVDSSP